MSEPRVVVTEVSRSFGAVRALQAVSFTASPGQLVAIAGRSGAGKTTLLNIVGGLDRPTSGRVVVAGTEVTAAREPSLVELRRTTIGFVVQTFGLISILTAAENVSVPLRLARVPVRERESRVAMLLEMVGLGGQANQRPDELSGGQQQRVAIARALANEPSVLLADEPTAQLDSETGRMVMELIRSVVRAHRVTALVATHDLALIDTADRLLTLRDGHLSEPASSASGS
jgi:putative ABC transport system ATP-binding protein